MTAAPPDGLVGRERELAVLHEALRTARTGRAGVTLVVGEPGIGKTRLLDEAATIARAARMRVLRGEADRTWRDPMELWRGVHRSLGIEPIRDPTLPAETRRWDHLESLADALSACARRWFCSRISTGPTPPPTSWVLQHLPALWTTHRSRSWPAAAITSLRGPPGPPASLLAADLSRRTRCRRRPAARRSGGARFARPPDRR